MYKIFRLPNEIPQFKPQGIREICQQGIGAGTLCHSIEPAKFSGIAPYAKESVLWSRWAAAFYLQQRQKGCWHHTAVRSLAYKWQRIIWKCWQARIPYKEEI